MLNDHLLGIAVKILAIGFFKIHQRDDLLVSIRPGWREWLSRKNTADILNFLVVKWCHLLS